MELVKIGQKGQLTIPRSVLLAAGVTPDTPLAVEVEADGAIVLRTVGVYPIESYSARRIDEFERENAIPESLAQRAAARIAAARDRS